MGPPGNSKRGPGRLFRLGVHPEGAGPPSAAAHPMIGGRTWVHHLPPKLVLELPQRNKVVVWFCSVGCYRTTSSARSGHGGGRGVGTGLRLARDSQPVVLIVALYTCPELFRPQPSVHGTGVFARHTTRGSVNHDVHRPNLPLGPKPPLPPPLPPPITLASRPSISPRNSSAVPALPVGSWMISKQPKKFLQVNSYY